MVLRGGISVMLLELQELGGRPTRRPPQAPLISFSAPPVANSLIRNRGPCIINVTLGSALPAMRARISVTNRREGM